MSRDEAHGGGAWAFANCLWAPTEKSGGGAWPFWSKILDVKAGDTILHLRGIPPAASFVGYSNASADGYETQSRPPEPGAVGVEGLPAGESSFPDRHCALPAIQASQDRRVVGARLQVCERNRQPKRTQRYRERVRAISSVAIDPVSSGNPTHRRSRRADARRWI